MLAAISHDLRTPLTRLKLRSERLEDTGTRGAMLNDISAIDFMVRGALTYLRDGATAEALQLVDLPSLLQTICDGYSDIGSDIVYSGPARLNFICRAEELTRAMMNIIDNGVKHGIQVGVSLEKQGSEGVRIEVWDDGPGIPVDTREVLSPSSKPTARALHLEVASDWASLLQATLFTGRAARSPCLRGPQVDCACVILASVRDQR